MELIRKEAALCMVLGAKGWWYYVEMVEMLIVLEKAFIAYRGICQSRMYVPREAWPRPLLPITALNAREMMVEIDVLAAFGVDPKAAGKSFNRIGDGMAPLAGPSVGAEHVTWSSPGLWTKLTCLASKRVYEHHGQGRFVTKADTRQIR